jgi:hypothetical protein
MCDMPDSDALDRRRMDVRDGRHAGMAGTRRDSRHFDLAFQLYIQGDSTADISRFGQSSAAEG